VCGWVWGRARERGMGAYSTPSQRINADPWKPVPKNFGPILYTDPDVLKVGALRLMQVKPT
jgi:hypothetical protein